MKLTNIENKKRGIFHQAVFITKYLKLNAKLY